LNLSDFKGLNWDAIGVAIDGPYAALWFGTRKSSGAGFDGEHSGFGVSYESAIKGLDKIIPMQRSASTVEGGKWEGVSIDKRIRLELFGSDKDISNANMRLSIKLDENGRVNANTEKALSTLLSNILPDWKERGDWTKQSLIALAANRTATRTKVLPKAEVEIKLGAGGSVVLEIRTPRRAGAIEF
jgi:hypothetical protein